MNEVVSKMKSMVISESVKKTLFKCNPAQPTAYNDFLLSYKTFWGNWE